MKRTSLIATIALGVGAAALLIGAAANAQARGGFAHPEEDRPSFSELDADGDGNLTIAEIQAMADARFAEMDGNRDGVISADEIAAAAAEKAAERAEMMFARLLEWRDRDGDGALSQLEMADNRAEQMFMRADANGDGVISAEEFAQASAHGPDGRRARHGLRGQHSDRRGG